MFDLHQIQRAALEEVVRQMPTAAVIAEAPSGKIVLVNEQAQQMVEQPLARSMLSDLGNLGDLKVFHPDGRPCELEELPLMRSIRSGEEVRDEEYTYPLADGTRLWLRCSSSPIYDEGRIVAGVLIVHDITERKRDQEQLAYYTRLKQDMHDAFIATDERLLVKAWNKGAERMYGCTADEALGRDAREVISLEMSDEQLAEALREIEETGQLRVEQIQHHKDGRPVHVDSLTIAMRDEQGEIIGYLAINRDITERKRAEETQARYAAVLEATTDFVGTADADWRVLSVNQAGRRMVGIDEDEDVSNTTIPDYYPEWAREVVLEQGIPATVRDGAWSIETAFISRDGREIPISQVIIAHKGRNGEVEYFSTIARDITERKQAEEQLLYHAYLLENIQDAVMASDERAVVTAWNKGAEEMFGWTADEVLGRKVYEVLPYTEYSDEQLAEALRKLAKTGRRRTEAIWYDKNGTPVHAEALTIALPGEQEGQITGYVSIMRDISERKKVEEALRESSRRIENILESITDAFYAVDREWRITYINERALRRMQRIKGEEVAREEIVGRNMWELYPDTVGSVLYHKYHEAMREQKTMEFEVYSPVSPKEWLEVHLYPSEEGMSIYYRDITERKQAEERLQEAKQRLEDLAVLGLTQEPSERWGS